MRIRGISPQVIADFTQIIAENMRKMAKKQQETAKKCKKLTAKQQRFVEEYLVDLNATKAAIRAGYSARTAAAQAVELLNKTEVKQAIEAALKERSKRVGVDQDFVLKTLLEVVNRSMQAVPVTDSKGNPVMDDNGNPVWQFNGTVATKASELLGKHLGMFQGSGTGRPQKHKDILQRYSSGELTLKQAALEFEMNNIPLPDTLRILLAKEQPEPEDPSKGEYRIVTDEELEAKVAERNSKIEAQKEGLPERREEMRKLHKRVQDMYAPGGKPKDNSEAV